MAKRLGADVVTLGYLETVFSFILMCGGPLYGRFGDVFGSRAALILSCSAAVLAYGILSLANSVPMLFLSRVPLGFVQTIQGRNLHVYSLLDLILWCGQCYRGRGVTRQSELSVFHTF